MPDLSMYLKFGFMGFGAIIMILFWKIISKEQEREGAPRKGITRLCYSFMGIAAFLALSALFLEWQRGNKECKNEGTQEIEKCNAGLKNLNTKIATITSDSKHFKSNFERCEKERKDLLDRSLAMINNLKSSVASLWKVPLPQTKIRLPKHKNWNSKSAKSLYVIDKTNVNKVFLTELAKQEKQLKKLKSIKRTR